MPNNNDTENTKKPSMMRPKPLTAQIFLASALILAGLLIPLLLYAFTPASAAWKQPFDELSAPLVKMSLGEQFAGMLALLIIKPTYMLLSLGLSILLMRQKARDLFNLGLGIAIFLAGEVACAVNYLFLNERSNLAEFLHSYSMAVAFGLVAYALVEGLDERILHFGAPEKKCALLEVCGPCVKYQQVTCGIRKLAHLTLPGLLVLTFIPWLTRLSEIAYNTKILTFTQFYQRALPIQAYEARFIPVASFLLFGAAWLTLFLTPKTPLHPQVRVLACAGVGLWGFGMFRVVLGLLFAPNLVWFYFWEELTELMFILAVMYLLWSFRRTLLPG
jgi:hypothetical protein